MRRESEVPKDGDHLPIRNSTVEFLIFATDKRAESIEVRYQDKMLWLTLGAIAKLFDVAKSTVSEHLSHIFDEEELCREATVRKFRTVRSTAIQ